jgi:hypothetical protein
MFRTFASTSFATLVIGAAALAGASLVNPSIAQAYDGRYGHGGYERPHGGWRAPPPVVHGYWGHRRWQRYHEGRRFYGPPPAHRYGWR